MRGHVGLPGSGRGLTGSGERLGAAPGVNWNKPYPEMLKVRRENVTASVAFTQALKWTRDVDGFGKHPGRESWNAALEEGLEGIRMSPSIRIKATRAR